MAEASLLGLKGKKALIIGGGQGMGEASAIHLARAGCDVALVDLVFDCAERVARRGQREMRSQCDHDRRRRGGRRTNPENCR